jgi:hypothetical protein
LEQVTPTAWACYVQDAERLKKGESWQADIFVEDILLLLASKISDAEIDSDVCSVPYYNH